MDTDGLVHPHLGISSNNIEYPSTHFRLFMDEKMQQFCLLEMVLNTLVPWKFEGDFRRITFKLILVIDDWGISHEIALRQLSHVITDDKSTLVQVMAWWHQVTSHYLSQCWTSSVSRYGITMPQWVKGLYTLNNISDHNISTMRFNVKIYRSL